MNEIVLRRITFHSGTLETDSCRCATDWNFRSESFLGHHYMP